MKGKDLLSVSDLSSEDIRLLISDAIDLKAKGWLSLLEGKTLAIMCEKPSLRTRVSFEVAMRQLGGQTIYLSPAEVRLGERESVPISFQFICGELRFSRQTSRRAPHSSHSSTSALAVA